MTVNTISSVAEFDTNGVTTNYPFYFKFLANEDLVVTYVNPLGVSSTLSLGTHYTVNGAGNDSGGSVVTNTALAGPGQLVVSREMEAFQQTSLRNQGKFLAETHEDVFDKLTMLIQQGLSTFKRALTRPLGRDYFFAENRRITSVKDPVDAQDAVTKNWVGTYIDSVSGAVNATTGIAYDSGTLFDYLKMGNLRAVDNIAALRLLSSSRNQRAFSFGSAAKGDGGGGFYYVDPTDTTSPDNGISIIVATDGARWRLSTSSASLAVSSIASLRLVPAVDNRVVNVLGYYQKFDGGGGNYTYDPTDTTSADNGGTVIVGLGGARWKLQYTDKVSVKQFGARGDFSTVTNTGTSDHVALQKAHDSIPVGVTIWYPLGLYFTTTKILVYGGSNVVFQSRGSSIDTVKCAIVGALGMDGIVQTQVGAFMHSLKVENMVVTRQVGATAAGERGLITTNIDQQVFVDCASFRHGIPVHVNGQLSPYFERLNTWDCNGFHVKISACVEPRFTNCRFGRNGGGDRSSQGYVWVDGLTSAGGVQVDTVEFLGCQFNQSGNPTGTAFYVTNYNNPNGIFGFTDCHIENWTAYLVLVGSGTTRLQRIKFNGCTIANVGGQIIGGPMNGVIEDFQLNGCTTAAGALALDRVTSASVTGGELAANVVVNQGTTSITGVRITGNVSLSGAVAKLTFAVNQVSGSITDTSTGTKYVAGNI